MRRMQNVSKPSIQMVYEACLGAEARPSVELAERLSLPERIPTPPSQRLAEPERFAEPEKMPPAEPERPPLEMVDPSVFVNIVEVTPPLITRFLPDHDPHDVPWLEPYSYFEPADLDSYYIEQEAAKGKGAFIQALWTQHAIPKLDGLVYKAWGQYGAQNLTTWTQLAQEVLDGCFGQKWSNSIFQVPDSCSICLSTMHWTEKTQCAHAFHLCCFLRHMNVSNTCPSAEHPTH
ncbi:hypothetical protein TNCV_1497881 [Trichonephila clavipes]|nr:hypothetical protein TNCV_1497881 [Trichonephila clavipes]